MNDDKFEWDKVKAKANLRKHKISFQEARRVFDDLFALVEQDISEDYGEDASLRLAWLSAYSLPSFTRNAENGRDSFPREGQPAMSDKDTIVAKRLPDGTLIELLPDGSTRRFPPDGTDWNALHA